MKSRVASRGQPSTFRVWRRFWPHSGLLRYWRFVYENWNAGDAEIIFTGQSTPMSAKGKLVELSFDGSQIHFDVVAEEKRLNTGATQKDGYYWVKQLKQCQNCTKLIRFQRGRISRPEDICTPACRKCLCIIGEGSVICQQSDLTVHVFNSLQGEGRPIDIALRATNDVVLTSDTGGDAWRIWWRCSFTKRITLPEHFYRRT